VFDPPISLVRSHELDGKHINIRLTNTSFSRIERLRDKYKVIIGYDVLRYNDSNVLQMIGHEITMYPKLTVISAGVIFKTDLCGFSGHGYYYPEIRRNLGI
jgi:hypothetical protein